MSPQIGNHLQFLVELPQQFQAFPATIIGDVFKKLVVGYGPVLPLARREVGRSPNNRAHFSGRFPCGFSFTNHDLRRIKTFADDGYRH
jgi:hypothetical protein